MKAVLVQEPFKIEVTEIPTPEVKNDTDVLVKVYSGGICGSDIGIYRGTNALATYPRIIGHEFSGTVEAVGSAVTNVKVGDFVAVDPVNSCGTCYACTHGRPNVCEVLEVSGVHRNGGFAEYFLSDAKNCHVIDTDKISKDWAALVEPYSIGAEANGRANTSEGDMVVVMGSGPIGIAAMQVAKARGAKVLMTDLVDERLERALEMGADKVVNVKTQDLKEEVFAWSSFGANVIIDSVCSLTSPVDALELASPIGRVVILGLLKDPSPIPQVLITKGEVDVYGSRLSNLRFPEVIEYFESGAINPEKLITQKFHYTEVEQALNLITEHPDQVCKVALVFD